MVEATNTTPASQNGVYQSEKKPAAFWLVFLAVCVATFASALELVSLDANYRQANANLPNCNSLPWELRYRR